MIEVERAITGYHEDDEGDWVAELSCGHNQHVRHRPPFQLRAWVTDEAGRTAKLGTLLDCPLCNQPELADADDRHAADLSEPSVTPTRRAAEDQGGEAACWVHMLCSDCGAMLDGGPHREGCLSEDLR